MTSLPHGMPVFVLDAQSSDGTVAYAKAAGARVEQRAWAGFVEARRYAMSRVETEWMLQIDADEALDDRLRNAIAAADGGADGYVVSRTTSFIGKHLRMWQDERILRLARISKVEVRANPVSRGEGAVHEALFVNGVIANLPGKLLHFSYTDYAAYRDKYDSYTTIEADGLRVGVLQVALQCVLVPLRFAKYLVLRGAILDGPKGWFVAWHSARYTATVALKSYANRT